jgi:uncharacterized protein YpmS
MLNKAIAAGQRGRPYAITLTEDEVNRQIQDYLRYHPEVPVSAMSTDLQPGRIVLTGKVLVGQQPVDARATGHVVIQNGQVRLVLDEISLIGIPLPGMLTDQVRRIIEESVDASALSFPVTVDHVEIGESAVTVRGTIR